MSFVLNQTSTTPMKNIPIYLAVLLFTFSLIQACRNQEAVNINPGSMYSLANPDFSVPEAKRWFDRLNFKNSAKSARVDGAWNKEIVWQLAVSRDAGMIGQTMIVPIHYPEETPLIGVNDKTVRSAGKEGINFSSRLIIWRNKAGEFEYRVHNLIPDKTYRGKKGKRLKKDFSGTVLVTDFDGNFLEGFVYKDGKKTARIGEQNGSRTATCYSVSIDWWSIACINGECYEPKFMHTEQRITCEESDHGSDGVTPPPTVSNPSYITNYFNSYNEYVYQVSGTTDWVDLRENLRCFGQNSNSNSIFRVVVFVDQPVPGYRSIHLNSSNSSPGHTWIGLEEYTAGQAITRYIGYYPAQIAHPISPNAPGAVKTEEGRSADVSLAIEVNQAQFISLITTLTATQSTEYDLNDHNCTHYVMAAYTAMGVNLPQTIGTWWNGGGYNPSDLGEDIRTMTLQPNMTRNTTGSLPGPNQGSCN